MKAQTLDAKKTFKACGTCSHTFCHLLNRAFEQPDLPSERATDLLAGGLMNTGHQCGMLWGATLAASAEAARRSSDQGEAIAAAISAAQHLMRSFSQTAQTVNCREITHCDLTTVGGLLKLGWNTLRKGMDNSTCFVLAADWAPEAIRSAEEGLAATHPDVPEKPISCASEVVRRMGATEEESLAVAGFAGGLGLSGNACGALAAAIWFKTLAWCRENPGKTPPFFNNPIAKNTVKTFQAAAGPDLRCSQITGRSFASLADHTAFVRDGGCQALLETLAAN